jgi:hypothetical protein
MKDFDVYFEIFGKKMKATVLAADKMAAENEIKNKIIFHKIEESKSDFNKIDGLIDEMGDILGIKKK